MNKNKDKTMIKLVENKDFKIIEKNSNHITVRFKNKPTGILKMVCTKKPKLLPRILRWFTLRKGG